MTVFHPTDSSMKPSLHKASVVFLDLCIRQLAIRIAVTTIICCISMQGLANPKQPTETTNSEIVRIAVLDTLDPWFFVQTFAPTMAHLRKTLPDLQFETREYGFASLRSALEKNEVDFLISPSGHYSFLSETSGAQHLATRRQPNSVDPVHASGSTLIVRKDDNRFHDLADLRGARVAAYSESSLDGWIAMLGALLDLTDEPEDFFGEKIFTDYATPDPLMLVVAGEADAAILRACELETFLVNGITGADQVKVIGAVNHADFACLHSTELYPDIVFASLPRASANTAEKIAVALLTMPVTEDGYRWGLTNSFKAVQNLYRELQIGPYSYLNETSLDRIWQRYREWFLLLFLFVMFGIVHIVRTDRLINIRTSELRKALQEKKEMEKIARKNRSELERIEKLGFISFLSGFLAHEIRQPVTALKNYSQGLLQYLKVHHIEDQTIERAGQQIGKAAENIAEIADHVRSYVKGTKTAGLQRLNLTEVLEQTLQKYKQQGDFLNVSLSVHQPQHKTIWVDADRLELELIVINLIKNAVHAVKDMHDGRVLISVSANSQQAVFSVQDNGKVLDDETFIRLGTTTQSTKPDGLGIGLTLCKTMISTYGGHIRFVHARPQGLIVEVTLPLSILETTNALASSTHC